MRWGPPGVGSGEIAKIGPFSWRAYPHNFVMVTIGRVKWRTRGKVAETRRSAFKNCVPGVRRMSLDVALLQRKFAEPHWTWAWTPFLCIGCTATIRTSRYRLDLLEVFREQEKNECSHRLISSMPRRRVSEGPRDRSWTFLVPRPRSFIQPCGWGSNFRWHIMYEREATPGDPEAAKQHPCEAAGLMVRWGPYGGGLALTVRTRASRSSLELRATANGSWGDSTER